MTDNIFVILLVILIVLLLCCLHDPTTKATHEQCGGGEMADASTWCFYWPSPTLLPCHPITSRWQCPLENGPWVRRTIGIKDNVSYYESGNNWERKDILESLWKVCGKFTESSWKVRRFLLASPHPLDSRVSLNSFFPGCPWGVVGVSVWQLCWITPWFCFVGLKYPLTPLPLSC